MSPISNGGYLSIVEQQDENLIGIFHLARH